LAAIRARDVFNVVLSCVQIRDSVAQPGVAARTTERFVCRTIVRRQNPTWVTYSVQKNKYSYQISLKPGR
jgi:hypothetical protein